MQKCPACKEAIKAHALKCRHCHHVLSADELAVNKRLALVDTVIKWGATGALIWVVVSCLSQSPPPGGSSTALVDATTPLAKPLQIRMDRFSWESHGDRYCNASAKVTNTSDRSLGYLKLTMQFLQGERLVASEFSYVELKDLAPGGSSTWDDMYACPGKGVVVDVIATANEGAVQIDFSPVEKKKG